MCFISHLENAKNYQKRDFTEYVHRLAVTEKTGSHFWNANVNNLIFKKVRLKCQYQNFSEPIFFFTLFFERNKSFSIAAGQKKRQISPFHRIRFYRITRC